MPVFGADGVELEPRRGWPVGTGHPCLQSVGEAPNRVIASSQNPDLSRVRYCGSCLVKSPPLTVCAAAVRYAPPVDQMIGRLKFGESLVLAPALGTLLLHHLGSLDEQDRMVDAIVPVPLSRIRLARRGFNQAQEIARIVARGMNLRIRDELLIRTDRNPPQSSLGRALRSQNVSGVFKASRSSRGLHVALIDDVMTTGATLHAAAEALLQIGASRVDAWVVARVP